MMFSIILGEMQQKLLEKVQNGSINLDDLVIYQNYLEGKLDSKHAEKLMKQMFIEVNNELKFFKLSENFLDCANIVEGQVLKDFFEEPKKYYNYLTG